VSHDGAATTAELYKWFEAYGPLADKIVDRSTYAFIEFQKVEDAQRAMEAETGRRLSNGRFLIVMPAKLRSSGGGGGGGANGGGAAAVAGGGRGGQGGSGGGRRN
jgi:uncharacterized membrane protein YgcG